MMNQRHGWENDERETEEQEQLPDLAFGEALDAESEPKDERPRDPPETQEHAPSFDPGAEQFNPADNQPPADLTIREALAQDADAPTDHPHDLPLTDERLLQFFERDEAIAVFQECHATALQACRPWFGRLDEGLLGKIAQDTALSCAPRYIDFLPPARKALTRVAARRRLLRTFARRNQQPSPLPTGDVLEAPSTSPLEQLIACNDEAVLRDWVSSVLHKLSFSEMTVVCLRVIEGMTYEDIAKRLLKTPEAVRALHFRGLQKLRRFFRPEK